MLVKPGNRALAEIRVRNYRSAPMKLEVGLVAPSEWDVSPDVLRIEAPPHGQTRQSFQIQIPRDWRPRSPRFALTADVVCDAAAPNRRAERNPKLLIKNLLTSWLFQRY
jgi:hypothetical protein